MASSSKYLTLDTIGNPHQPMNFEFPKREFGKTEVVLWSMQRSIRYVHVAT